MSTWKYNLVCLECMGPGSKDHLALTTAFAYGMHLLLVPTQENERRAGRMGKRRKTDSVPPPCVCAFGVLYIVQCQASGTVLCVHMVHICHD